MSETLSLVVAYFEDLETAYRDGSAASCNWADSKIRDLRKHLLSGNKIEILDNGAPIIIESLESLVAWKRSKNFQAISFGR